MSCRGLFRLVSETGGLRDLCQVLLNTVENISKTMGEYYTGPKERSQQDCHIDPNKPTTESLNPCQLQVRFFWFGDCSVKNKCSQRNSEPAPAKQRILSNGSGICRLKTLLSQYLLVKMAAASVFPLSDGLSRMSGTH